MWFHFNKIMNLERSTDLIFCTDEVTQSISTDQRFVSFGQFLQQDESFGASPMRRCLPFDTDPRDTLFQV